MVLCLRIIIFFFFQAEDGIRDTSVTGVQTCALPISARNTNGALSKVIEDNVRACRCHWHDSNTLLLTAADTRSEERRVGKECTSLRAPQHVKQKRRRKVSVDNAHHLRMAKKTMLERC